MTHRVLVCGSRSWSDYATIRRELAAFPAGTVVIHGGARGADTLAGMAAAQLGMTVIVEEANWQMHGRAAGAIRNAAMLRDHAPDEAIAFRNGQSPGTNDMIRRLRKASVPVRIVEGT